MNIQQLEYILAVDTYRHFAKAAEHCRVTQPTLSMMIQKLEDELGIKLFDRNMQPVCPTPAGRKVIDQARTVLYQASLIKDIVNEEEQSLKGTFRSFCTCNASQMIAAIVGAVFISRMRISSSGCFSDNCWKKRGSR